MKKRGLSISTSGDGRFRIYSWDDGSGGTMRFYENVYQYSANGKVFSYARKFKQRSESEMFLSEIYDIHSGNKTFYLVECQGRFSSAYYYTGFKVYTIANGQLKDDATLIRTRSGMSSKLGTEVDFSAGPNRDRDLDLGSYWAAYDPARKEISIPLIESDNKISEKQILYCFNGTFFEYAGTRNRNAKK